MLLEPVPMALTDPYLRIYPTWEGWLLPGVWNCSQGFRGISGFSRDFRVKNKKIKYKNKITLPF